MHSIINGIYDGKGNIAIRSKLGYPPDTKIKLQILSFAEENKSFLEVAGSLNINGPADWSEKIDEYLYTDSHD